MRRPMINLSLLVAAAAMVGCAIVATPAEAKRRYCMDGHFHYGSSSGQSSKKKAQAEAIASWAGFTAFEYGNAYASFKQGLSRRVSCSKDAGGWGCNVEAIPCRIGR